MNILGTFYTLVLVFIIYFFLKMVYYKIGKKWREGFNSANLNGGCSNCGCLSCTQ